MENKEKITKVFEENFLSLYRYSYSKLNNKEEAEDIVSSSFEKLMNQNIDEIQEPKYWLFIVARNDIYKKYRERSKMSNIDESKYEVKDEEPGIEEAMISEELIQGIRENLDKLDDLSKEVLTLKIWEDMTFGKIAEVIEEKESTVKLRYYRAIDKIKSLIITNNQNKLFVVSAPAVILAMGKIGASAELIPAQGFTSNIISGVLGITGANASNLLNTIFMENISTAAAAKVASTSTASTATGLGAKFAALSAAGKFAVVSGTAGVITATGIAGVAVVSNVQNEAAVVSDQSQYSDEISRPRTIEVEEWSFDVPGNWIYAECSNSDLIVSGEDLTTIGVTGDAKIECNFDGKIGRVSVSTSENVDSSSIPSKDDFTDPNLAYYLDKKEIMVDGNDATQFNLKINEGPASGEFSAIYIDSKNTIIRFNKIESDELITMISDSFKFMTIDFSEINLREIETNFYSLSIPSDWIYFECNYPSLITGDINSLKTINPSGQDKLDVDCGFDGFHGLYSVARFDNYAEMIKPSPFVKKGEEGLYYYNKKTVEVDGNTGTYYDIYQNYAFGGEREYEAIYIDSLGVVITGDVKLDKGMVEIISNTLKFKETNIVDLNQRSINTKYYSLSMPNDWIYVECSDYPLLFIGTKDTLSGINPSGNDEPNLYCAFDGYHGLVTISTYDNYSSIKKPVPFVSKGQEGLFYYSKKNVSVDGQLGTYFDIYQNFLIGGEREYETIYIDAKETQISGDVKVERGMVEKIAKTLVIK